MVAGYGCLVIGATDGSSQTCDNARHAEDKHRLRLRECRQLRHVLAEKFVAADDPVVTQFQVEEEFQLAAGPEAGS